MFSGILKEKGCTSIRQVIRLTVTCVCKTWIVTKRKGNKLMVWERRRFAEKLKEIGTKRE